MIENFGVFQLITELCETHLYNRNIAGHTNKNNIKRARSKCYEILLSKQKIKSYQYLNDNSDALCNLLAWQFQLSWDINVPEHAEKLDLCSQKLQDLNAFSDHTYSNVVSFLLELRSTPTPHRKIMDTTLDISALRDIKDTCLYDDRQFHISSNENQELKRYREILSAQLTFNSKVQNDFYKEETNLQIIEYRDEGYRSHTDIWEMASHMPVTNHRTWETFGELDGHVELPFVCEAKAETLKWLCDLTKLERVVAGVNINAYFTRNKILPTEFIKCVKYLLVGIETDIFKYGPDGELALLYGTTIEGLSCRAIESYCKELITCSSCYNGLNNLCTVCPIDRKNEQNGYIFLELCSSIKRFLSFYRVAVLSFSNTTNLLTFHDQTRSTRRNITLLASVCKVGPFRESGDIPHGVTLLNYLYKKVTSFTNEDSLMALYSVIYPCCKVYFRRFVQQWILDGTIHDPYGEFFINANSKYISSRGRTYWTRSFTLREDIVPEFLTDLRRDILFCGKAMNLLKLCMPNSALCLYLSEKDPKILDCCLLPEQLSIITNNNSFYYLEMTRVSGPRLSLADMISRAREQHRQFLHLVAKKKAATLVRIELERKLRLQLEYEQKQSKIKNVRDQYYEALAFKSITVATKFEEEAHILENDLELQRLQDKIITEEKAQLIDYYDKLTAESEKRWNYYKRQVENLKCELNPERKPDSELESKNSSNSFKTAETSRHSLDIDDDDDDDDVNAVPDSNSLIMPEELTVKTDNVVETIPQNYKLYLENNMAAQRNKLKVLSVEMGEKIHQPVSETNRYPPVLTDAQRNKLKVMSSEFGISVISDKKRSRSRSAAEINKIKMLASSDCFNMYHTLDNFTTPCDNDNYINKNVEVDNNTNIIVIGDDFFNTEHLDKAIVAKKPVRLSLDFSKLKTKNTEPESSSKFELSPMSIDSPSISTQTTPNINIFDNLSSPAITTAKTEFNSDAGSGFIFESDIATTLANFEKQKFEFALEKELQVDPEQLSKINPSCFKFCLEQSVLIPLVTQIKLVTNELLKYYINDLQYLEHLNSLRNYFFLLDGEFCRNITEGLFEKLYDVNFPMDLINVHTLQILVYNALDYSTKFQENSQCLSFKINNLPKVFNLCDPDVFDCISLVYKTSWPLNILLPLDTISKYDDIFKMLLKVHRVSWILHNMYQDLKLLSKEVEKPYRLFLMESWHYRRLHHYRHVMTQFIQSLQNYIVGEVLQSSWHVFEKNLESVKSFDQLYTLHSTYIKSILFLCLLNQKSVRLRTALQKIFIVILKFYSYLRSRCWDISDDNVYTHPNFNKLESLFNNFEELVLYFFKFSHKVVRSGYQPQLMQLLDMLDVNNYYSIKLQNLLSMSNTSTNILD